MTGVPLVASNGSNCGQVFSVSVLHWGVYLYTYFFLPICSIFSGQGKIAIESSYVYFFFICLATIKRIKWIHQWETVVDNIMFTTICVDDGEGTGWVVFSRPLCLLLILRLFNLKLKEGKVIFLWNLVVTKCDDLTCRYLFSKEDVSFVDSREKWFVASKRTRLACHSVL